MPAKMPRGLCASKEGAAPKFDPTEADWQRIATAWGVELTTDQRDALTAIVDRYLDYEWIEQEALPARDLMRRARKIRSAAHDLNRALIRDAVLDQIDLRINDGLLQSGQLLDLNRLPALLSALMLECDKVLTNANTIREGDAWGKMIGELTKYADEHGARNGAASDGSSRFVDFVWTVQEAFPAAEYRRHCQSKEALAKAIQKARR